MEAIKTKLSPPWYIYVSKLKALFEDDPEVGVMYDSGKHVVKLLVSNATKAVALEYLLNSEVEFGNYLLEVEVVPANDVATEFDPTVDLAVTFAHAFENNPALSYVRQITNPMSYCVLYVVFKNRVVQFYADNLADVNGNISTLYEDLAREVLADDLFAYYCTDTNVTTTESNWP